MLYITEISIARFLEHLKIPSYWALTLELNLKEEDIQYSYDRIVFSKIGDDNYQFMFIQEKRAVASLKFLKEMYEHFESEYATILDDQYFVDETWAYRTVARN